MPALQTSAFYSRLAAAGFILLMVGTTCEAHKAFRDPSGPDPALLTVYKTPAPPGDDGTQSRTTICCLRTASNLIVPRLRYVDTLLR